MTDTLFPDLFGPTPVGRVADRVLRARGRAEAPVEPPSRPDVASAPSAPRSDAAAPALQVDFAAMFAAPVQRTGEPGAGEPGVGVPGAPKARSPRGDELLEGLNPPQREAVLHAGSPVLVVAGAGSGKTRVLTRRIAYLISERNVHPGSVLAITFTNKAAAEMRSRVVELVGNRARLMWVSTFHSACVRILRADIDRFGMAKNFSIYDDTDAKRLMSLVVRDAGIDTKKYPVRSVMNWVSNCKNELIDFESARGKAINGTEEIFADCYADYQRRLTAANALDFDDLIMMSVNLLQAFPDVRERYRRRFRHVLVDEYQDTNHAQYALIRELCGVSTGTAASSGEVAVEPPELMVVGDSDQSIYAFRGADIRNILGFAADFPGAQTSCGADYRSTQTILTAPIGHHQNANRPRSGWSDAGDGDRINYVADTEHRRARFIAGEIDALVDAGGRQRRRAVFYRTNAQSAPSKTPHQGRPAVPVVGRPFYERRSMDVSRPAGHLEPGRRRQHRRILNVPSAASARRGDGEASRRRTGVVPAALVHRQVLKLAASAKQLDRLRRADRPTGPWWTTACRRT